jgi:hypothetical protein
MASIMELGLRMLVWKKAVAVPLLDPARYRHDDFGDLIAWNEYGDRNSPHGWEMDHYPVPKAMGGADMLDNLRPLHCRRNAQHGGILGGLMGFNSRDAKRWANR